ncbi:MAG: fructosamine kinase family protein [Motiliproteus sp.]|nr:fructosamine kinase family protein [Motiliproteus sp.]MCW9054272.1 fructosamine kinase family protein [Motiliproteus sp.]
MGKQLIDLLHTLGCADPQQIESVSGGCINQCYRVDCQKHSYFLKTHSSPPPGFFQAEAEGLIALHNSKIIRVPEVIGVCDQGLLLEYLTPSPSPTNPGYWKKLAEQLADLHQLNAPCFGFGQDNFCGLTPQPNPQTSDGYQFFANHRLGYQAQLAAAKGLLKPQDLDDITSLSNQLKRWIPDQSPCLIHGDLWSGNVYCSEGEPVLVDPACYWGWAEAELAMTRLFGGFSKKFYDVYQANRPEVKGWQQRADLYNLYHLLNHLNLFGSSYLGQVRAVTRAFLD